MATFHAEGKSNLTILVGDYGVVQVTKQCLCAMFGFQPNFMHVSKDAAYVQNNVVIHSIYQTFFVGAQGLHWMVNVRRYQIVGESLQKNLQDTILTPNTIVSIVNVVVTNIEVKNEPKFRLVHFLLI
jgi:hypothetical protein